MHLNKSYFNITHLSVASIRKHMLFPVMTHNLFIICSINSCLRSLTSHDCGFTLKLCTKRTYNSLSPSSFIRSRHTINGINCVFLSVNSFIIHPSIWLLFIFPPPICSNLYIDSSLSLLTSVWFIVSWKSLHVHDTGPLATWRTAMQAWPLLTPSPVNNTQKHLPPNICSPINSDTIASLMSETTIPWLFPICCITADSKTEMLLLVPL